MQYERLTEYDEQGIVHYVRCNEYPNKGCYGECGSCGVQIKGKQHLAELEDKIENGTLLELPCKVGDKLYLVSSPFGDIEEWEITDIVIGNVNLFRLGHKGTNDYNAVLFKELGEYAFSTKDEAKKRLEELKEEI